MRGQLPQRFVSQEGKVLPGVKQILPVPNPASGSEWSYTVPGGEQWRVLGGFYTFTASATVGNRIPSFAVTIQNVITWHSWDNAGVAASGAVSYTLAQADPPNTGTHGNGLGTLFTPHYWLPDGSIIGSVGTQILAGDQYSAINLWVERLYVSDSELTDDEQLFRQLVLAEAAMVAQATAPTPQGG